MQKVLGGRMALQNLSSYMDKHLTKSKKEEAIGIS